MNAGAAQGLFHFLLALVVILVAARVIGALFTALGQPQVIGEMFAGIVVGPSALGHFAPSAAGFLFPDAVMPQLAIVAQIGVVLFMFLVGVDLDARGIRERPQAAIVIAQASMAVPFLLGGVLALYVYPRYASSDVPFVVFALFFAVSMSVTAFPVLARILTDRKMSKTRLGVVALTCAAIADVTAWCMLALVVSAAQPGARNAFRTIAFTAVFVAGMLLIARPVMKRWAESASAQRPVSQLDISVVFIGLLSAALLTEWIGIHALFGAFLFGALIPHDSLVARDVTIRLNDAVTVLFLPVFFAFTGLRLQIGLMHSPAMWLACAVIVVIATLGKFGGSFAAARLTGLAPRDSAAIGILMNTRGLMELVVLNLGLDLGVLTPTLFAMLVLMALVTTFATSPLLSWLYRGLSMQEAFARGS